MGRLVAAAGGSRVRPYERRIPVIHGGENVNLRSDDSFTLNELELRIKNVDDPIEVLWTRFRPDIVNTLTISQEYTGRYYVLFKRDTRLENRLNAYPKSPRSRQDGIGRAGIHYHPK